MKLTEGKTEIEQIDPITAEMQQRASASIILLPDDWPNQNQDPVYRASTLAVQKLYMQWGIPSEPLTPITAATQLKDERGLQWVAPTLLISGLLVTQNPSAVAIALNVIANYVSEIFGTLRNDPTVKLSIIQTAASGKTARKLTYVGPVSGLPEVSKVVSNFSSEE